MVIGLNRIKRFLTNSCPRRPAKPPDQVEIGVPEGPGRPPARRFQGRAELPRALPVGEELEEEAHAEAGAALGRLDVVLARPRPGRRCRGGPTGCRRPRSASRKCAAMSAPPYRVVPTLRRSATSLSSWRRRWAGIGSGHTSSPAVSARRPHLVEQAGVGPMRPAVRLPRATSHAPVSVARSMMASGPSSLAFTSASARISRPSASVFITSTVVPPAHLQHVADPGGVRPEHVVGHRAGRRRTFARGAPARARPTSPR